MIKMSKKIILIISFAVLLILPIVVRADCDPGIIMPSCICSGKCDFDDFVALFIKLANWGLTILGGITIVLIMWSAWGLMTSAGNPEKIKAGQQGVINTLLGLFFVLAAWSIVNVFFILLVGKSETTGRAEVFGSPWYSPKSIADASCSSGKACTDIVPLGAEARKNCVGEGVCSGDKKDKNGALTIKGEKYSAYYQCCPSGSSSGSATSCSPASPGKTCQNIVGTSQDYRTKCEHNKCLGMDKEGPGEKINGKDYAEYFLCCPPK